jgi:hypothetical protein
MKKTVISLAVIFCCSCAGLKYGTTEFYESVYVCDLGGMMGKSIIQFKEDSFFYSERDSLFYGSGKWSMSDDGKYLMLNGSTDYSYSKPELSLENKISFDLKIKDKRTLIGNDKVFIRMQQKNSVH